jgi:ferric-dicitrate binding protein FerR (iron transport regulator)
MERMDIVWQTPEAEPQTSDMKELWKQVAERAGMASGRGDLDMAPESTPETTVQRSSGLQWNVYRVLRYAAILILAAALPYVVWKMNPPLPWTQQASELKTVIVPRGQRTELTLSDGSRITLDAASRLDYPERFGGDTREVFLHGEAYFEVASTAERPFVVHADHAVVRVLGTRFNVRAWRPDREVRVTVAEGTVSLGSERASTQERVVLSKGQSSTLPEHGPPSPPRPVDVGKHLAWMRNEWVFEDVPLDKILHQLERWYDLSFALTDPSIATERVTVHLQKTSIDDVLELIAALADVQYERTGTSVHFTRRTLK